MRSIYVIWCDGGCDAGQVRVRRVVVVGGICYSQQSANR